MSTPKYSNLIYLAYIKPIRSVVMIDDQFPSYIKLLEKESDASVSCVSESAKNYLRILCNLCQARHWTYHIEDNIPKPDTILPYAADLIFLDFKLGEEDDGEKAIDAIEVYSQSDKFNFIVVYTEENVSKAFSKIVTALGYQSVSIENYNVEEVENLNIEYGDFSNIAKQIAKDNFCDFILCPRMGKKAICNGIRNKVKELGIKCGEEINSISNWALAEVSKGFPERAIKIKHIAGNNNDDCNWLQIDHLFLTVINKQQNSTSRQLIKRIVSAINEWNPTPGQILLKDAKNQIDNFCIFDLFKSEKHEPAWFYFTYLSSDKFMQENELLYNLIDLVKDQLNNRFHKALKRIAKRKEIHHFYPSFSNNINDLFHDINIFNSTFIPKNVVHFSTGMIFRDTKTGDYWICMTQACDLVPTQHSLKWIPGKFKPITFVKLHNQQLNKSLSNATRGNTVFFNDHDNKKNLCLSEEREDGIVSNPHYEIFFAPEKGRIVSPSEIPIFQVDVDRKNGELTFNKRVFSFVSQLRQEYASMLLQKISNHRSRTPVNYISLPPNGGQS